MKKLLLILPIVFSGFVANATPLEDLFDKLNTPANVSVPGSYKDQRSGHWTVGGIKSRNQVKQLQPIQFQPPGYKAGCGGIDLYMGGMSFVTKDELIKTMKYLQSNAAAVGFNIAMDTLSAQTGKTVGRLLDMANQMNMHNINSCELGTALATGILPKSDLTQQHVCSALATHSGYATDMASAKHACNSRGQRARIFDNKGQAKGFEDILTDEYNLVWKAINKTPLFAKNRVMAEMVMTLVGTVTSRREGDKDNYRTIKHYYPSLATDDNIQAFMYGDKLNNAHIYECTDSLENCFQLTKKEYKMSDQGIVTEIGSLLESISYKVRTEGEENVFLTEEEIDFINATRLPIMKFISLQAALKRGGDSFSVLQYRDIIAYEMVLSNITRVIDDLKGELINLQQINADTDDVKQLLNGMRDAAVLLHHKFNEQYTQFEATLHMIDQGKALESNVMYKIGRLGEL